MRRESIILAGAFLGVVTAPGVAQQPPAPPSALETVIVTANAKSPAIWHATKDGADVAILGIVQPLPDNFVWNTKPLEAALSEARLVLLPPNVQMGILSGAWFYLTESDLLHPPHDKTLWDVLDSRAAAALAEASGYLREPKDRYSDNSPIVAAMRLGSDFRHVDYLTTHEPEDSIAALARARHVKVRRIATYDLVPSGEELLKLPPAATGRCIEAAVNDIGFLSRHVAAAANAWALGDISAMMANRAPSQYYACLVGLSPHATQIDARSVDDTIAAIDAALADGGSTVAVVDVGVLLRPDGVLDRLRADGISVTGP